MKKRILSMLLAALLMLSLSACNGVNIDINAIKDLIANRTAAPTPIPATPIPTLEPTPVPTFMPTPIPTVVPTPIPTPIPTPVPHPRPRPHPRRSLRPRRLRL